MGTFSAMADYRRPSRLSRAGKCELKGDEYIDLPTPLLWDLQKGTSIVWRSVELWIGLRSTKAYRSSYRS